MPVPTVSFLLGLVVLGYLLTFVAFAVLRIVTGVSIQRIGFSGLKRISFSPRNGIRIDVRDLGLAIHRPTFALPTWCSLLIGELVFTIDLNALGEPVVKKQGAIHKANGGPRQPNGGPAIAATEQEDEEGHGKLWRKLTGVKEKIKQLHSLINWIRLVDVIATATTVNVVGVGTLRLERLTVSVDTRSKTVDRSRLFQHYRTRPKSQTPAEWKAVFRSILLTAEGRDSTELLDYCTLNIHGMLHNELQGLRDASISLKLGRLNVPYDDIEHAKKCADMLRGKYAQFHSERSGSGDVSLGDALEELERPGSREGRIVRTVSDSRAFVASMLRGIHEVQVSVGFFGLSRKLNVREQSGKEVYFNLAMKEVGLDVLRLDPKSPAHRMYFATQEVAHQGLLTAIAISAGIDDGNEHPERMLYIPMVTATVKTTLPSRTIRYGENNDVKDRNTNMLYANLVCTSPSVDLDPKHLPLVRDLLKQHSSKPPKGGKRSNRHQLISSLLPKSDVKLSIQEPVVRVSLPPMDKANAAEDDFDLLISSVSSITFDLESSHAQESGMNYSLGAHYRHTKHRLYYQTVNGDRHDLLQSDTVELHVDVNAIPDTSVSASANFRTFTIFLVRPDICEGVRQIVKQLKRNVLAHHEPDQKPTPSFLRTLPAWLHTFRIEGTDFGLELAGIDEQVSKDTRGFALQLESWSTEYKAHRDERSGATGRRRSMSRGTPVKDTGTRTPRHRSPKRQYHSFADARRLTVHVQNLEGTIVDSVDHTETESFMSMPQFEVAFSTSTDNQGPIFHINSHAKSLLLQYSLYNHFAMGVAIMVIKNTFLAQPSEEEMSSSTRRTSLHVPGSPAPQDELDDIARNEITTVDFKANLVQLKARMPADPPMMLQIHALESGRHRWARPFLRSRLTRLYVRAPKTKQAWSRIVSVKSLRLDMRDIKRKVGKQLLTETSIDVAAESIRLGVPHGLVVHSIFDNITNVIKTTKQLQHHFVTGTNDYVLTKEPESPKLVPKITLRCQLLIFDVEDSGFEWKLGSIYRSGLAEQKQRLARDEVFRLKEKRLARCAQQASSRRRTQSARPDRSRSQTRVGSSGKERGRSVQADERSSPQQDSHQGRRKVRYDAEGKCGISDSSKLTMDAAKERLSRLNAQSWKNRIDRILYFQTNTMRQIRHMLWGNDELAEDSENQEPIMALSQRPALLVVAVTELHLTVDKPSFPLEELPRYLHDIGKGMPRDMKYGLLLPMNLQVTMGELRFQLRDYPLPLIHVPALANGQSPKLPALSMRTNFVIAEEFRDIESQRDVKVEVIPPEKMGGSGENSFAIDVRRTISPVKTYSDMKFEINTSNPTKITWGTSYQPAIQDMMQVIEGFTKPPVDLSDRVGFWDKIRLSFHSRVNVAWKGDGDVHLVLKGSRDPYNVTGTGAGLVMVWRNDVRWNIAQSEDPRQFMTVDSGDYILAVPDFNSYARHSQEQGASDGDGSSTSSSSKRDAVFKKVVMKLSGNVRWLAGLMFERDLADGKRVFEFKNHYDVVLKHPDYAKAPDGQAFDAFEGFRSNHIHLSIAIAAPQDRDWSVSNLKPSDNYNTVHLTPRFFTHFFHWWSMFSGIMSLPVRQGPLWGVTEKKSKKFGRHLATIKYNLLLSPLYISHVYKHKDAEEYQSNTVSATGLKTKIDSFMLDLHQRREQLDIKGQDREATKKTSAMRINAAQVDFIHADLRALSATITGTNAEDIENATEEQLASLHGQTPSVDMSKFDIPDHDFSWIDMDDYVELDWILPAEGNPDTKILPLSYAPRFTYFRQTDHEGVIAGDASRTSPFGDEPTHYCVMSAKNDPRRVQAELIERRLETLREQRVHNDNAIGEQELKFVREAHRENESHQRLEAKLSALRSHSEHLHKKHGFLQDMLRTLEHRLANDDPAVVPDLETSEEFFEAHENARRQDDDMAHMDAVPLAEYTSDFNNRFIVHNTQIKWNNSLRNIILRYIHQNSQRRGFVYYMSRRAVKFILDVIEERRNAEASTSSTRQKSQSTQFSTGSPGVDDEQTVQDRIEQLLKDGRSWVNADEPVAEREQSHGSENRLTEDIAQEFTPLNTFHFRLISPQIQLQSEKNSKSAVLVTAKGMQLKVVQIMDKDNVNDDVSGLVQRRFTAAADSLQMFVTSTKTFSTEFFHMYSANLYGAKAGTQWPPWVPMEIMFEYQTNPYGFNRVVHRTSASLRYDKYNNLRLKYNDDVSGSEAKTRQGEEEMEDRMDHIWLEFPHFRAIADSTQYYALYIIVMDLLLYSEPLEKTRNERLERIMLASDFSDLSGAPDMVQMLQDRIRQLEEIKLHFQVNEKYLDRQGWKDRISMDQDLAACEDELFFIMKAITTAQQRLEDRREQENSVGLVHLNMSAREIAWHLVRETDESLVEFQLKNASFDRTDNNDGSNHNVMEIGRINGFNLLPDALYPEIIAPFTDDSRGGREPGDQKMLRIQWLMLEAIAGIPVVDYFEINLVPLKMQFEREVAKKLFEYIFPGVGGNAFEGGGFSPLMVKKMLPTQEEEDESEDNSGTGGSETPKTGQGFVSPEPDQTNNGPGSLQRRLHPTTHLSKPKVRSQDNKGLGISGTPQHEHRFSFFQPSDRSKPPSSAGGRSAASRQGLSSTNLPGISRSPSERSLATTGSNPAASQDTERSGRRNLLHRSHSDEKKKKKKRDERSDDLTQMMSRASNYMTLSFVKIPSMVLCLSYKGAAKRNLEDVHDLVFRMPTLEYRNKTWSNLDLALQLKKDLIRALVSHTGAILTNKFSHHKPSRQQQSRLREIANLSTFISTNNLGSQASSETSSVLDNFGGDANGRASTSSARPRSMSRSLSIGSPPAGSDNMQHSGQDEDKMRDTLQSNGQDGSPSPSPQRTPSRPVSQPAPPGTASGDDARSRTSSISRHFTGFGDRSRNQQSDNTANSVEEGDDKKRRSKFHLGGQKLLRSLRDK
ncbi:hypothetical protein B0A50_07602 [Salinomyces thailandicus]|uniref:Uncharacterized protein n=1 Tax=Salinomyces thailandicus TaxID=706561 RepID=A0A4V5N4Y8_9PEZI|nr:hypothetical protein B0A50_07602 [Salinomyces thailandica]